MVRCGTGSSSRVRARAPPVKHLIRGDYKRSTRFKADKDIMDALVHLRNMNVVGRAGRSKRRRASPGDVALGHALR